jgi:predicted ATPase
MAISTLRLSEFSVFQEVSFSFSPGINVFIGRNSTGKSHVLKLLYALCKTHEPQERRKGQPAVQEVLFREKLAAVFKPDDGRVGRLVHRRVGRNFAAGSINSTLGGRISFELSTLGRTKTSVRGWGERGRSLFLPSREVLALYEGFADLYRNQGVSFDETYFDVCVALTGLAARGPRAAEASETLKLLENAIGGSVSLIGPRFYVQQAGGRIEAHLVAEGLRKLASVAHLVANGSLRPGGLLFWDEPEANLNPRLIRQIVEVLRLLAAKKTQVFLASHDYLLTQRLALLAKRSDLAHPIRFFSLYKPSRRGPVVVEQADLLADIPHNGILKEFARYYDDQQVAAEEGPSSAAGSLRESTTDY